jgi:chromosome segregation ATPase
MAQLTLTDISKRFCVNRTTIYRAVNNGKISRLDNGMFDLAEVIRAFGEPAQQQTTPPPASNANDRELIAALKSQVDLLTKQLEKKDAQIDFLQNRIETSQQRHNATPSNDSQQQSETPINKDIQEKSNAPETISNVTMQHSDTLPETPSIVGRLSRGIKAFLR